MQNTASRNTPWTNLAKLQERPLSTQLTTFNKVKSNVRFIPKADIRFARYSRQMSNALGQHVVNVPRTDRQIDINHDDETNYPEQSIEITERTGWLAK